MRSQRIRQPIRDLENRAAALWQARNAFQLEDVARVECSGKSETPAGRYLEAVPLTVGRDYVEVAPGNVVVVLDEGHVLIECGERGETGFGIVRIAGGGNEAIVAGAGLMRSARLFRQRP